MLDNSVRLFLPRITTPLMSLYRWMGITPNGISITSFLLSVASAVLCIKGFVYSAIGVWWLGRLLDGTDGIYARHTNQQTDFGGYLDIVCDMASYALMIVAFAITYPEFQTQWLIILFLYVLCIASALALGSLEQKNNIPQSDNRSLRLGAGLAEGGETGIAYTLFLLFPSFLGAMLPIWIAILAVTVISRSFLARNILSPK